MDQFIRKYSGTFLLLCMMIPFSSGFFQQAAAAEKETGITDQTFGSSNLPVIVIDTHGQIIPDEPKIEADMGIIWNGDGQRNALTDPFNDYSGKIGIEIRGSSSQMYPKKQYGVETRDENGDDLDVSLLGLPEENDWVLYAPYADKTLLRNVLAYKLYNDMGRYASRSVFCELVLNGEYQGVYVLMEKIKRDKNRVDISKLTEADTTGDDLTGGYIIKIDKIEGSNTGGWYSAFLPYPGAWQRILYQYDYPDEDELLACQITYIQNYIYQFESMMSGPDFNNPEQGYPGYIDVDCFVDYFIHTELAKNVDGYRLSAFLAKDKDSKNKGLQAGPVWDYNFAFGNADYYDAASVTDWQVEFDVKSDEYQIPFWWKKLAGDSLFKQHILRRWHQLRGSVLSTPVIDHYIDSMVVYLDESQTRNFEKWPILNQYVWPNPYIGGNYISEILYLKNWLHHRLLWMDNAIEKYTPIADNMAPVAVPAAILLEQSYPNPFNSTTIIRFFLPERTMVNLSIYDVTGRKIQTLLNESRPAGYHSVEFSAENLASAVYLCRLKAANFARSQKILLVR